MKSLRHYNRYTTESHHRSEKECSDIISIYGSAVQVLITSSSGLERGSTILGQTVYRSYSDSDCDPTLVQTEESHQV